MPKEKSISTRIVDGEIPSEMLYADARCVVIKDINPQVPTHVLVISRKNIPRLAEAVADDESLLGHLLLVAGKMASKLGVDDAFRLVINNGADASQTVFHLHIHILANKSFAESSMDNEFW